MPVSQKRLGEIAAIADENIDTSDIPEADKAWFEGAKLVRPPGGESTAGPVGNVERRRSAANASMNCHSSSQASAESRMAPAGRPTRGGSGRRART